MPANSPDYSDDYHLLALKVARDPRDPRHSMPTFSPSDRTILDIGCGAGQSLIASDRGADSTLIGVDVNEAALVFGRSLSDDIQFVNASAEAIPLASASCDLVFSRVSLPYTDIPRVAAEIARLLVPGGRCWITFHRPAFALRELMQHARGGRVKGVLYELYVLANGLSLHFFGRLIRYPLKRSRLESVQTTRGVRRAFLAASLGEIEIEQRPEILVLTARRVA